MLLLPSRLVRQECVWACSAHPSVIQRQDVHRIQQAEAAIGVLPCAAPPKRAGDKGEAIASGHALRDDPPFK